MFKNRYAIESLSHSTARDLIVKYHYLHRQAPCSFSFAMRDMVNNEIVGCVLYGTPSSAPLRRGICGDEEKNNVIELTRLWIRDDVPRNAESFLISHTVGLVDKEIVVSFADPTVGHCGYIYQAVNWIYTGLSAKRTNWTVEGMEKHCQTIADKYTSKELREKFGDKFSLKDRPRKHRYVFFNCNKKRKKELMKKLNYPILPYPKIK